MVGQGETVKFTATVPVTWGLAKGSPGTIDPDGTYHAPNRIVAKAVVAGCQVLPNDHLYNTRIDTLPVDPHSSEWIAIAPNGVIIGSVGDFGINLFTNADKQTPQHFNYSPQNDGNFYLAPPDKLRIEHGSHTYQTEGHDRHEISINYETCLAQEIYDPYPRGLPKGCPTCTAQSGAQWSMMSYAIPLAGTDAASLQLLPLTYRRDEIVSGNIQHAGRFTLARGYIAAGEVRWPAQSTTGGGAPGKTMPMGARVRLKSSYPVSSLKSPYARNLAQAFARYGLILADIGAAWNVETENSVYDPDLVAGLGEIFGNIHNTDFEVVDESSLMIAPTSGIVNPANGFVDPGSAVVIATATDKSGRQGATAVALKAPTVGADAPWIVFQAGSAPRQLKAWVNGTENRALVWSMQPAVGSLSRSGMYQPPASVSGLQSTTVKVASEADPAAFTTFGLSVLPGGIIRINSGATVDYTDPKGNIWYGDMAPGRPYLGMEQGHQYNFGGEYAWRNTSVPTLFNDWLTAFDNVYRLVVPNGNYKVTLKLAEVGNTKAGQRCSDIESQGQIIHPGWDTMAVVGVTNTAVDVELPAKVTDGTLSFALRDKGCLPSVNDFWTVPGYKPSFEAGIGAVQIEPDVSMPRISIDHAPAGVTTGQKIQLQAARWYLGGEVRWSIVSGPGTISADGTYSAPRIPQNATVAIRAQSTEDASKTATVSLRLTFGDLTVDPPDGTVAHSLTRRITAKIGEMPYPNVDWHVSSGSISPDGLYTAPLSVPQDTSVSVTATSRDDLTKSAVSRLKVLAQTPAIRVNFGDAGAVKDDLGNVWESDPGPTGGDATTAYSRRDKVILNAAAGQQPLYLSARYGHGRFWYVFPLPNGRYRVTLKFADYSGNPPGTYGQSVLINGVKVLAGFDLMRAAGGPLRAYDAPVTVTVTNSSMRIEFASEGDKLAYVNGVEIVEVGPNEK